MTEDKKTTQVENDQFEVESITIVPFRESVDEIEKVNFQTNKGVISWKPKIKHFENLNGFNVERLKPMLIGELPEVVTLMNTQVRSHGKVFVTGSYKVLTVTEADGSVRSHKFLVADMVKEWKFSVGNAVVEETVVVN